MGDSFWGEILERVVTHVIAGDTVGDLTGVPPYMYRASGDSLRCLKAALERKCSPELYHSLDGVHIGHTNQRPADLRTWVKALSSSPTRPPVGICLLALCIFPFGDRPGVWNLG